MPAGADGHVIAVRRSIMGDTHPVGLFTWTDISTSDPGAGKEFYTGLFGWNAADQHDPEGNYIYTLFSVDGQDVAGMGPLPEELAAQGIPPFWNSYVTVTSVDDTIDRARAAGGTVAVPAMDVMDSGRMAFIADPVGATVALWEPKEYKGASLFNSHGAMTWNELATSDLEGAREFYGEVLGWGFERIPGDMEYWLITLDTKIPGDLDQEDQYNGGIMSLDGFPEGVPPYWGVYFQVDDTDAAVVRAEELGGSVVAPAFDTSAGRIAVLRDPQGGMFSVIEPTQAAQT